MQKLGITTKRFVVYDDDGYIYAIQTKPDDKLNNLETEIENVEKFLNGSDSFTKYRVEYDFIDKEYKIVSPKEYQDSFKQESFLYRIPTQSANNADVKIIQDNVNRCWKLVIDPELPEELKNKKINIDPSTQFYSVTKKNDPNVLITVLRFDKTLTVPFADNFKFDNVEVSVYTMRKFNTYEHEVVDG